VLVKIPAPTMNVAAALVKSLSDCGCAWSGAVAVLVCTGCFMVEEGANASICEHRRRADAQIFLLKNSMIV